MYESYDGDVGISKFQEGGFAMQQATVQGNSSKDNLRNASVAETNKIENIKQKVIDDTTKKKIPAKDTDVDIAKLNDPEGLLAKYKVSVREGGIPVKENDDTSPLFIENQNYLQNYHNNVLEN